MVINAGTFERMENPLYLGEIELAYQPVPDSILCLSKRSLSYAMGTDATFMMFNVDEIILRDTQGYSPFHPATLILSAVKDKRMEKITRNMEAAKMTTR